MQHIAGLVSPPVEALPKGSQAAGDGVVRVLSEPPADPARRDDGTQVVGGIEAGNPFSTRSHLLVGLGRGGRALSM